LLDNFGSSCDSICDTKLALTNQALLFDVHVSCYHTITYFDTVFDSDIIHNDAILDADRRSDNAMISYNRFINI